jgi:hypothetical protein
MKGVNMQTYFSFYDRICEIEDHSHLYYLREYSIDDLLKIQFCKSILEDLIFDKNLSLTGKYKDQDAANEIQLSVDYLLRLHTILNERCKDGKKK